MATFDARRRLKATTGILVLAAVTVTRAASAQPESPLGADAPLPEMSERIREIQSLDGLHSPDLIDPLTALALYYQEQGEPDLAAAAVERARQVVRTNYGLYALEEAPLLRQLVRLERARGDAEAAWDLEQKLLALIRRHPNDLRAVPILREIADKRMDILRRYRAGEFPPEIVLGCYYSEWGRVDSSTGLRTRTGCRSGSKRAVINSLWAEAARYRWEAERILARRERWLSSPCEKPQRPEIPKGRLSRREARSIDEEVAHYLTGMSIYVACLQVNHEHIASTNASSSELSQLVSDRQAAADEFRELTALYEERIGPIDRRP